MNVIYTKGTYLENNPTWHVEDSAWKAKQVMQMMERNHLLPQTVCEVGCGAGEILRQLQENMNSACTFEGYDISAQALELAKSRENERLRFMLTDIRHKDVYFDLMLIMDVIEHLEDYFSFLQDIKTKSRYVIMHIPLEITLEAVLKKNGFLNPRRMRGHIHHFTKETAIETLTDVGYEILDYFYTPIAFERPMKTMRSETKRRLLFLPRKIAFAINRDFASRLFGGWSLLVLVQRK